MKRMVLLVVAASLVALIINFTYAQTDRPKSPVLPVYCADGTSVPNIHMVVGEISIPANSSPATRIVEFPVTLTNAAAFRSADSYKCFASRPFGAGLLTGGLFRNIDGSHFAFRTGGFGPAWQQDFFCIGN